MIDSTTIEAWNIPQYYSPSRRGIVREYMRIRMSGERVDNIARSVSQGLGYSIDRNGTNTFVRSVISEFVAYARRQQEQN